MARQPFFGQGPAPQIARMDMQSATAPGRNWGKAIESIGQTVGDTLEKFRANKEKKKKEKVLADTVFNQFKDNLEAVGADNEDELRVISDSIGKHPETLNVMEFAQTMRDRGGPAKFLQMMAGPAGTSDEIMDAIGRRLEASPPPPGTAPAVYGTAEELEAAGIAEMQRRADLKRAEADLGTLGQPLSEASRADFLKRFRAVEDPAIAKLALGEFVRRETPKPGGTIRTVMIDGKPKIAMIDSAGNIVRIVGDAPAGGKWVHTPAEREQITRTELESKGAFDFLQDQRGLAISEAAVIRPASRALTLLESDIQTGGAFDEFQTDLVTTLSSLGVPLPKSITDEAKDSEEFRAQVGEFLFLNIQKTKGSISEKEMDIFKEISPNLAMSTAANKSLLKYTIGIAERNKRKIKYIQELRRSKIPLSEQQNKLEDWMLENDLSELVSAIPSGRGGAANTGGVQIKDETGKVSLGKPADIRSEEAIQDSGYRIYQMQDGRVMQVPLGGGN